MLHNLHSGIYKHQLSKIKTYLNINHQVPQNETLVHCYNPLVRDCEEAEEGEEQCRVYQETACTTQYVERSPGQHVGDTRCENIPVNYCTRENCRMVPGPQECHDKVSVALLLSGC